MTGRAEARSGESGGAQGCSSQSLVDMFDSGFFKALADGSRLAILLRLAEIGNARTVTEIAQCCPQSISVVSRHLKILKDNGILAAEKRGKEVIYHFRNKEVAAQLRTLADLVEGCC